MRKGHEAKGLTMKNVLRFSLVLFFVAWGLIGVYVTWIA